MARTRTLLQMRDDVKWLADIQSLTLRHTDAALIRAINQSAQRFREMVSAAGINHFLTSVTKSTTAGASSPYPFFVLDLSSETVPVTRVYSIDASIHGQYSPLSAEQFSARLDYQGVPGPPSAFASMTTYRIALFPIPDASYPLIVWYLAQLADMVNDVDTFDGIAGYEEWITWDVLLKVFQRDQYPQLYGTATAERDKLEKDMIHNLTGVNASSVGRRRDTTGQRLGNRAHSRNPWGGGVHFDRGTFDDSFDGTFG